MLKNSALGAMESTLTLINYRTVDAPLYPGKTRAPASTGSSMPVISDASWLSKILGVFALAMASVNIFGGFLVTARMLAMYKKKGK